MDTSDQNLLEIIRQQFNNAPYPRRDIEDSPREDHNNLFMHNLVTSFYLRDRCVVDSKDRWILDAGCGSGYKSLILAEANPGAKIVGIDLSEESVSCARLRLDHHGFKDAEFHALSIYDLPQLGMSFDYINCDEVLYSLPDPIAGLQAMKAVLKPDGIIRANLHSASQRQAFYRSQQIFKMMGLLDQAPTEFEAGIVIEIMKTLRPGVELKKTAWKAHLEDLESPGTPEKILMNFLLAGDKGFTIPNLFALLETTDLAFISMVNWRHWQIRDLLQNPDDLPAAWELILMEASIAEQLHLYELLNPVHRLLDFYCGHADRAESGTAPEEWEDEDWQRVTVHLHPQLRTENMRKIAQDAAKHLRPFAIGHLPVTGNTSYIDSSLTATLLPLWDEPQPFGALVDRYLKIRPIDPITLEPPTLHEAAELLKSFLISQSEFLYILLEQASERVG